MMSSSLPSLRLPSACAFLLLVAFAAAQEQQVEEQDGLNEQQNEPPIPTPQLECELFLAESTVPNAGVGIFTAVERKKGDDMGVRDLCIPLIEMDWHNNIGFFPNVFEDYAWWGDAMGMDAESGTKNIEAYCPGLDATVNCHPALLNLEDMTQDFDDGGLRRHEDPGVGAFTPYHNGTMRASRLIPVGGEIFKDYSEQWFDSRQNLFYKIPLAVHYEEASAILKKMKFLVSSPSKMSDETFEDLYNVLLSMTKIMFVDSRIIKVFPDSYQDALKFLRNHDGDIPTGLIQPKLVRSVEWLRQHGRCVDHILPGDSNIRQAGHGAFATRNLPKGTVIATSPLLHVPDPAIFNIYNYSLSKEEIVWVDVQDQILSKQLMINYCYSHPQTSLLLCPYISGVNHINHDPDRHPNVKIRWAVNFPIAHKAQIVESGTIDAFKSTEKPIVAFDYVATRDIAEGDELFLDYGDDWVAAWSQHVEQYEPYGDPNDAAHYEDAQFWNRLFNNSVLRTEDEQEFDPYPEHLEIRCHSGLLFYDDLVHFHWDNDFKGAPCRILYRHIVDEEDVQHFEAIHGYNDSSGYRPKLRDYVYTVELEERIGPGEVTRYITPNIPRQSLAFVDVPLTTDTRLPNAFRHWIGIPDDMMPQQWKNLPYGEPDLVDALLKG